MIMVDSETKRAVIALETLLKRSPLAQAAGQVFSSSELTGSAPETMDLSYFLNEERLAWVRHSYELFFEKVLEIDSLVLSSELN